MAAYLKLYNIEEDRKNNRYFSFMFYGKRVEYVEVGDKVYYKDDLSNLTSRGTVTAKIVLDDYSIVEVNNFYHSNTKSLVKGDLIDATNGNLNRIKQIKILDECDGIEDYTFNNLSAIKKIDLSIIKTKCGLSLFRNCESLEEVILPKDIITDFRYMFQNCHKLKKISIPNSVTNIGNYAFYNCRSLKEVIFTDNVTEIGEFAFYNCSSLENVKLTKNISKLEASCFQGCYKLTNIEIPDKLIEIKDRCFTNCMSLKNFMLPNSLEKLGIYTFAGCSSLQTIMIPSKITELAECLFNGCIKMESVTLYDEITKISDNTFNSCSKLKKLTIIGRKNISNVLPTTLLSQLSELNVDSSLVSEYETFKTTNHYNFVVKANV